MKNWQEKNHFQVVVLHHPYLWTHTEKITKSVYVYWTRSWLRRGISCVILFIWWFYKIPHFRNYFRNQVWNLNLYTYVSVWWWKFWSWLNGWRTNGATLPIFIKSIDFIWWGSAIHSGCSLRPLYQETAADKRELKCRFRTKIIPLIKKRELHPTFPPPFRQ